MDLSRYLTMHKITSRQFARAVGESVYAVRKWRQKTRVPRPTNIIKIKAITKGKVREKDWF